MQLKYIIHDVQACYCLDAAGILAFKCTKTLKGNTFLIIRAENGDGFCAESAASSWLTRRKTKGGNGGVGVVVTRDRRREGRRVEIGSWQEGGGRFERGERWRKQLRGRRLWPDGDVGTLSQSAAGALQSSVNLPHLYRPFQAHHLQQLVTEVWMDHRDMWGVKIQLSQMYLPHQMHASIHQSFWKVRIQICPNLSWTKDKSLKSVKVATWKKHTCPPLPRPGFNLQKCFFQLDPIKHNWSLGKCLRICPEGQSARVSYGKQDAPRC